MLKTKGLEGAALVAKWEFDSPVITFSFIFLKNTLSFVVPEEKPV